MNEYMRRIIRLAADADERRDLDMRAKAMSLPPRESDRNRKNLGKLDKRFYGEVRDGKTS